MVLFALQKTLDVKYKLGTVAKRSTINAQEKILMLYLHRLLSSQRAKRGANTPLSGNTTQKP